MGVLRRRRRPDGGYSGSAPVPGYEAVGAVSDGLGRAANWQQMTAARDLMIGTRVLFWLRCACVVIFLQWAAMGIVITVSRGKITWFPEMPIFTTTLTVVALVVLLMCWRPSRWVPRLREVVNVGVLFGTIFAAAFGIFEIAFSLTHGGSGAHSRDLARTELYEGLSLIPALLIGIVDYVLLYVSYRMHPNARKTLYQDYKYNKRVAAELQARDHRMAGRGSDGAT